MAGSLTCVLYHHIGEESDFERGLAVTTSHEAFERQISQLALDYDIVDLNTVISGKLPKRALLITFDDFYRSVYDVCENVLSPMKIPSVFFLNADLLGAEKISTDCFLSWYVETAGMGKVCSVLGVKEKQDLGTLIGDTISGYSLHQRARIREKFKAELGPINVENRNRIIEPHELEKLPDFGVEIGNHTATHVHCSALAPEDYHDEIVASKQRLETLSKSRVRSFSIPYGNENDLTPEVLKVLRDSGHEAIFLVHARSNRIRPAPDIWYRVSLHNEKPEQLKRKLRILPPLRSFKKLISG